MFVPTSDLLKGTWYSLEQCGRLLKAAAILYKEKDYSTAVGVAMLAREELGKHRILRDEWRKSVDTGKAPGVEYIQRACEDHIEKQKRGRGSVTLNAASGSVLGEAIKTVIEMSGTPTDSKFKAADSIIKTAVGAIEKHAPAERHEKRLEGFFVDLANSGTDWKRPSITISQEEASKLLKDAANGYAEEHHRFSNTALLEDKQLAEDLEAWSKKPALPPPTWPE